VIVPPLVLGLVTVAVFAAVVNQVVQLWRAPEDRPLRAVALSVLCFAAQAALALPPLHPLLEGTSPGLTRLLVNVAAPLALFWVLAFFLYSTHGPRAGHALRVQLVPLVAALAVETAAWTLAPVRVRIAPATPANAQDPHAVVFVVAALTYMSYALALSLRWSVPYARAACGSSCGAPMPSSRRCGACSKTPSPTSRSVASRPAARRARRSARGG
jgi:hypothetical protein